MYNYDFDNDGCDDIIVNGTIEDTIQTGLVINGRTHREMFRIRGKYISQSPVNLDDDEDLEFIAHGYSYEVVDGQLPYSGTISVHSALDGSEEWEFDYQNSSYPAMPSMGDFDGDGRIEFQFATNLEGSSTINVYGFPGDGAVRPDGESVPERHSLGAFPNPFNNQMTINYTLEKPGDVKIALFDPSGRRLGYRAFNSMSAGSHVIPLSALFPSSQQLPAGCYWVVMDHEDIEITKQILKLP